MATSILYQLVGQSAAAYIRHGDLPIDRWSTLNARVRQIP